MGSGVFFRGRLEPLPGVFKKCPPTPFISEVHMKRFLWLAGILAAVLASSPAAAQITRGADQPNQNKWNAKGPWGKTERSAPLEAQKKKPFKLFDNVWYVGFQTVSV